LLGREPGVALPERCPGGAPGKTSPLPGQSGVMKGHGAARVGPLRGSPVFRAGDGEGGLPACGGDGPGESKVRRGFLSLLYPALLFLSFLPAAFAHGGRYRAPTTPEPVKPGGQTFPGGLPSMAGAPTTREYPDWRKWWALNWEGIVDMRVRLARAAPAGRPGDEGGWKALRPLSPAEKKRLILPALEWALKSRDREVRAAAVIALGKLALPSTLPLLRRALKDKVRIVRNSAALALGLGGFREAEEDLLRVFRPGAALNETRAWAAVGLGFLGTDRAVRALLDLLQRITGKQVKGSNREVLVCSAAGLTVSRSPLAAREIPLLLKRAGSRLPPARSLLYLALGKIGDRRNLPVLEKGLREKTPLVLCGAAAGAGCLATPGDRRIVGKLMELAGESFSFDCRAFAVIALGRIGGSEAEAFLEALLERWKKGIRPVFLEPFVALGLGLAGMRRAVPVLLPHLDSGVVDRKGAFALALGMLGGPPVPRVLAGEIGRTRNPRCFAEVALGAGLGRALGAVPVLERILLRERKASFRVAAAAALGLLGGREKALDQVLGLLGKAKSAALQTPLVFAMTLLAGRKTIPRITAVLRARGTQDRVRALCCAALGNLGDSRRRPVLSRLSRDFPWPAVTPVLNEILYLY